MTCWRALAAGALLVVAGCHRLPQQPLTPPIPPGERIDVGGFALNYRTLGASPPGAATATVVMLHGFGASSATWLDIEDELRDVAPLLQIDLKGFGYSDRPPDERYRVEDQVRAVSSVITQLGLRDIVLLGHSYGGGIAIGVLYLLRERHPTVRVHALVLIDAATYDQDMPFFIDQLRNPITRWLAFTFMTPAQRVAFTLERITRVPGAASPARVARYAPFHAMPGSNHALAETAEQMQPAGHDAFVEQFATITQPTLILWGERDPVIPVAFALRLDEDIPDSERHVLPQTGHVPHEERPADAARIISEFLTRVLVPVGH
jgi:pimeloyl-ACP methyl ester carboxylesterase